MFENIINTKNYAKKTDIQKRHWNATWIDIYSTTLEVCKKRYEKHSRLVERRRNAHRYVSWLYHTALVRFYAWYMKKLEEIISVHAKEYDRLVKKHHAEWLREFNEGTGL